MPHGSSAKPECPQCGEIAVAFRNEIQKFGYGADSDFCEISAEVPVGRCHACGCIFMDERAETLRHEAVCRHLGVHTPAEIIALRKRLNLSRAALAEITRIGEASIARWERGAGIQNGAMDRLLYLLGVNNNLNKLRAYNSKTDTEKKSEPNEQSAVIYKFPDIVNISAAEKEAASFSLRASTG